MVSRKKVIAVCITAILLVCFSIPSLADWKSDMARIIPSSALDAGHWWVLGSFKWTEQGRLFWGDRPLPPDGKLDLNAVYRGWRGTEIRWKEVPEWDKDDVIYEITKQADMEGSNICLAAYLYRRIDSPADTDAILYLGFDDGAVIRLNGETILQRFFYRGTERRQEAIPIRLNKGRNDFVIKLVDKDNTSAASFCFDIRPVVPPEKYASALETLISRYPNDKENVFNARRRLIHLYRQMGDLRKADLNAKMILDSPLITRQLKEEITAYFKSRPSGIGIVTGGSIRRDRAVFSTSRGILHVGFWKDSAPRITFVPSDTQWPYLASQRPLPISFDRENQGKILGLKELPDRFMVDGAKLDIEIPKSGAGVNFVNGGKRRYLELGLVPEIKRWEWSELRTYEGPFEQIAMHMRTREAIFGMGNRYDSFNRRGRFNSIGNCDRAFGESHFTLPYYVTQSQDALFINSFGDGDISSDRPEAENTTVSRIQENVIDFFYFVGEPKSVVRQYVDLTGHTVMPPDWTLGVWMSRNSYEDENVVLDVAKNLRRFNIPSHVLVLEAWREDGDDWMSWNEKRWPNHAQMCKTLHDMGFKIVLWTMQFHIFNNKNTRPYEKEALENGYFTKDGDKPAGYDRSSEKASYIVDFFNPAAVDWWKKQYSALFDPVTGIDGLKTDIGENNYGRVFPGWTNINNIYALGYIKTAWEMTKELTGEGMVFARTGTIGTQQYPILWAGDHSTWFQGMQEAYNAMMNAGLAGYAWVSYDVGGLYGDLDRETYVRMAQMGAFCPIMQCHGMGRREPYDFDEGYEAVDVFNQYANWYMALKPYRIAAGQEACKTGIPILRPMWMEYPDDPQSYEAEFQYFFGPDILCAPIFSYNHTRSVYLPKGKWVDWWTGEQITGGRAIQVQMPLEKMPIYVRPGSDVLRFSPVSNQ